MNTKFFLPYRLLIEVSILQAGPASLNTDTDRFSAFELPKEEMPYSYLVLQTQVELAAKTNGCNKT